MDDKVGTWVGVKGRGVGFVIGKNMGSFIVVPRDSAWGYTMHAEPAMLSEAPTPDPVPEHLMDLWEAFEARRKLVKVEAERDAARAEAPKYHNPVRWLTLPETQIPPVGERYTATQWGGPVEGESQKEGEAPSDGARAIAASIEGVAEGRAQVMHSVEPVLLACIGALSGAADEHVRLAVAKAVSQWLYDAGQSAACGECPRSWRS